MYARFAIASIRCRVKIEHLAVFFERLKPVSASFRDDQTPMRVSIQHLRMVLQEGWRALTKVDRDVVDSALEASNDLELCMRRVLKVQATNRARLVGDGAIDLANCSRA